MYLFFDTETSGFPVYHDAPFDDFENWPHLVQVAWILADENGTVNSEKEYLIKPEGFEISEGAQKKHRISTEFAIMNGVLLKPVLEELFEDIQGVKLLVAHHYGFDSKIVGTEFLREGMENIFPQKEFYCTMKETTNLCKIPGESGYRWPSIGELYQTLFSKTFYDSGDAMKICSACKDCYFELKKRNWL